MSNYDVLANNVLSTTLGIQPGDDLIVETWDHGLPIAAAFIYRARELSARPMLLFEHEETYWKSVDLLPEDRLGKVGEHEWAAIERSKGYIFIPGPANFMKIWKNFPKFRASTAYNEEWYQRAKRYRLKGARIALAYATRERARSYKLSLAAWQKMLLAASSIDYATLKEKATKLAPLFRNGEVKITAPNGTNLSLQLAEREPYAEDCIVDPEDLDRGRNVANIPGGSLSACPDETKGNGSVIFDQPTPYMGKWVNGVRFEFKDGALTNYQTRLNASVFKTSYEKATGDKSKVALVGVGLNPKARTGFLQDSIAEGAVTVGIGGNDHVGGKNKTDYYFQGALTKATLTVDGNVIVKKGRLVI
jgi:leucyl aminopeptidase (aminopeptidase T)